MITSIPPVGGLVGGVGRGLGQLAFVLRFRRDLQAVGHCIGFGGAEWGGGQVKPHRQTGQACDAG